MLSLLAREVNFQRTHKTLPTIPSLCCRTALRKLEVRICSNFQKKQSKNRVTFDKNWNVSCHMAEYLSQQLPEVSSVHLLLAHIRKDAHAQRRGKRGGESSRGTCPQL